MRSRNYQIVVIVIVCCLALLSPAFGQVSKPTPTQQINKLIHASKSNDPAMRFRAAEGLGNIPASASLAVPTLIELLKDKDSGVRFSASIALKKMGASSSSLVPALIELLKDNRNYVRYHAAYVLGNLRFSAFDAVPALTELLENDNSDNRSNTKPLISTPPEIHSLPETNIQIITSNTRQEFMRLMAGEYRENPNSIAYLWGEVHFSSKLTSKDIIKILDKEHGNVRESAYQALSLIFTSVEDEAAKMSYKQLDTSLEQLKKAKHVLVNLHEYTTDDAVMKSKAQANLLRATVFLEKEQQFRERERIISWVSKNKVLTGVTTYLLIVLVINGLLWAVWPIGLLRINESLKKVAEVGLPAPANGIRLPAGWLLGFGLLQSNKRVLDAWVNKYAIRAYNQLLERDTFKQREVYVELEALLNGKDSSIGVAQLHRFFADNSVTLLLWGEGGSGKTTLACQMALWALAEHRSGRLCETHRMLPIFIEENIVSDDAKGSALLLAAVLNRIKPLAGEDDLPSLDLVRNLLRYRRLLLIVDGVSELNAATRSLFLSENAGLPLNALIVTSRTEEMFPTTKPQTIHTQLLGVDQVASFLKNYLAKRGKPDLFTDSQLSANLAQFYQLVGQREITVLLARLYADYLIDTKETPNAKRLHNVPELMDAYLNELCRKVDIAPYQLHEVHEMARLIAWEAVRASLKPAEAMYTDVEKALAATRPDGTTRPYQSDPRAAIAFFVDTLHLLQKQGMKEARTQPAPSLTEERFKFALDPPSEYLAARHLVVSLYRDDQSRWDEFFTSPAANPGDPKTISGFILALYETWNAFGKDGKFKTDILAAMEKQFQFIQPAVLQGPGNLP